MKKIILCTLLLVFSVYGFSQEPTIDSTQVSTKQKKEGFVFKGVKYGVRGGYNISNLDFEEGSSTSLANKHRNSFYFGFFAYIGLTKTVSLVPELQFSSEGANDERLHLDYIQAPLLLRVRLNNKFHLTGGGQIGLKVHKVDDGIKTFAYSAVGGLEYRINHVLFADARYTYGLTNVFDDHTGLSGKNSNIQIGIGYKF